MMHDFLDTLSYQLAGCAVTALMTGLYFVECFYYTLVKTYTYTTHTYTHTYIYTLSI